MAKKTREELKFEIVEHIGVLSTNEKDWSVEVNKVSWNEKDPKYDIRAWNADHTRMGKGVTLTEQEFEALVKVGSEHINSAM